MLTDFEKEHNADLLNGLLYAKEIFNIYKFHKICKFIALKGIKYVNCIVQVQ